MSTSLLFYALIIHSCPFMYCHFVQALDDDHLGNTELARKKGLCSIVLNLCACVSLLMFLPAIILITVNR